MGVTLLRLLVACKKLFIHRWHESRVRRALPDDALNRLSELVAASEKRHTGRIQICAEGALPWSYLLRNASSRDRALVLFSKLRIWDTEDNNGVLIYLLIPEQAIEIVADRGISGRVPPSVWEADVWATAALLRIGRYEAGLALAVDAVSENLIKHYPKWTAATSNEPEDHPSIL